MKKIFALGLMFVMFAPSVTFVVYGATLPCTRYPDGSNNGAAACYTSTGAPLSHSSVSGGLSGGTGNVILLVSFLQDALNIAVRLILAASVAFFLWGVFQFVRSAGDEEALETGKKHIIYGVIGIAVMVSLWGLVNFLTGSANLDLDSGVVPALPSMPTN